MSDRCYCIAEKIAVEHVVAHFFTSLFPCLSAPISQYRPPAVLSTISHTLSFSLLNLVSCFLSLQSLCLLLVPRSLDSPLSPLLSLCLFALGIYCEWQSFALSLFLCSCTVASYSKHVLARVDHLPCLPGSIVRYVLVRSKPANKKIIGFQL